jgi:hypothetical protein
MVELLNYILYLLLIPCKKLYLLVLCLLNLLNLIWYSWRWSSDERTKPGKFCILYPQVLYVVPITSISGILRRPCGVAWMPFRTLVVEYINKWILLALVPVGDTRTVRWSRSPCARRTRTFLAHHATQSWALVTAVIGATSTVRPRGQQANKLLYVLL